MAKRRFAYRRPSPEEAKRKPYVRRNFFEVCVKYFENGLTKYKKSPSINILKEYGGHYGKEING
jgi:hypothetical protein